MDGSDLGIPVTARRESEHDAVGQFLDRILNAPDPHPYVGERDRVFQMAPNAPGEALPLARRVSHPWYRSQALAAVARWIEDAEVGAVASEAIAAALECHDDYKRSAVLAWPIACLAERGRHEMARAALQQARRLAETATPNSSRACSLLGLLRAAWSLGSDVRRLLVQEIADLQRADSFWRVSQALVDAVHMIRSSEPDLAKDIVDRMQDERWKRKATERLHDGEACSPETLFRR